MPFAVPSTVELDPPLPPKPPLLVSGFVAPAQPDTPSGRPRRRKGLLAAWFGSVLLLAAIVALAIVERGGVMEAWPPSIRLYTLLRLH